MDDAEVVARVERHLGRHGFRAFAPADLHFEVEIDRTSGSPRWRAAVRTTERGQALGQRLLTSDAETCDALSDALALVLALTIDPSAIVAQTKSPTSPPIRTKTPQPRPTIETPPPREPPPMPRTGAESRPPTTATPRLRRTWRTKVTVEGGLGVGLLPSATPLVGVGAARAMGAWWDLSLAVEGWLPARQEEVAGEVSVYLLQGGAKVCLNPRTWRRFAPGVCTGVLAGVVHSQGRGFSGRSDEENNPFVGVPGDLRADWLLGDRWFVRLRSGALFPVVRTSLYFGDPWENRVTLHEMPALAWTFALGLGCQFR